MKKKHNSRVSREHKDESLRNVELTSTTVDNWAYYDTVLICTSSSSGLGQSGELLEEEANGGNWLEGHRFRENPSDSDINNFVESIQ